MGARGRVPPSPTAVGAPLRLVLKGVRRRRRAACASSDSSDRFATAHAAAAARVRERRLGAKGERWRLALECAAERPAIPPSPPTVAHTGAPLAPPLLGGVTVAEAVAASAAFASSRDAVARYLDAAPRTALWPHQEDGIAFMARREEAACCAAASAGGLLCFEMRMGKTRAMLAHILRASQAAVRAAGSGAARFGRPTLLVCSGGSLVADAWRLEIRRMLGDAPDALVVLDAVTGARGRDSVHVPAGGAPYPPARVLAQRVAYYDLVLTTPSALLEAAGARAAGRAHECAGLFDVTWERLVVDEAHIVINREHGKRHAALRTLRAHSRWLLTATPMQNYEADLRALLAFVGPAASAANAMICRFRDATMTESATLDDDNDVAPLPFAGGDEARVPRRPARVVLHLDFDCAVEAALYVQALRDFIQRANGSDAARKTSAFHLQHTLLALCVTPECLTVERRRALLARFQAQQVRSADRRASWQHAVQCAQPRLWRDPAASLLAEAQWPPLGTKLRFVCAYYAARVAPVAGDKLVVFAQRVEPLRVLARALPLESGVRVLHGKLSDPERVRVLRSFREDAACRVLLLTIGVGGIGIDLTCANHAIVIEMQWNPTHGEQALQRVQSMVATAGARPVTLVTLVMRHTLEEHQLAVATRKARLAARVMGRPCDDEDDSGDDAMTDDDAGDAPECADDASDPRFYHRHAADVRRIRVDAHAAAVGPLGADARFDAPARDCHSGR